MKIVLVLYDAGKHAADEEKLYGSTENKLGIANWLKDQGHELITTSDKEGETSELDKHIPDADIIITTPFHPAYITKERLDKAKNLKLVVVAGVGSDHIDLDYINQTGKKISVLEVTGSNVVSVAEHVVMTMLVLVRNFVPAHEQIINHDWEVAAIAKDAYDIEGKTIATIGAGRIGYRVLERLLPFNPKELLYYDYQALPKEAEEKVGARRVENIEELVAQADIVTVNAPLHAGTKGLINKELLSKFKKGAWLVNTARGAICVAEDVAAALESGQLRGYGGDVWFPQPAPKDHPWRDMRNKYGAGNAMTPHYSGTTLDAQTRYAEGTKNILESFFTGKFDYRPQDIILLNGEYVTKAYGKHDKK
nr:formate dehydrogenase [synthetic construct]